MSEEIQSLDKQYEFLHWHLAFPDVFRPAATSRPDESRHTGWDGGFDVVLGNPPWERIKLQEREWFAARRPEIANVPNAAARRKMIASLESEDPSLFVAFHDSLRVADAESHLLRNSGRFPLCGKGDINTYAVFAETKRSLLNGRGRVGCIVPAGIATDSTTKDFFQVVVDGKELVSLFGFENESFIFPAVHHFTKFCLLTLAGQESPVETPDFIFFARTIAEVSVQDRHFTLTADDIKLINPNSRTCPIFRRKRDAEITKAIYRRVPVLIRDGEPTQNPWGIKFSTMFHMSNDSDLFRTREQLETAGFSLVGNTFVGTDENYLPLYEAKMMHHFTHRYGDYGMKDPTNMGLELPEVPGSRLEDSRYSVLARYWVSEWEVIKLVSNVPRQLIDALDQVSEESAKQVICAWFGDYLTSASGVARNEVMRKICEDWNSVSRKYKRDCTP